jgi:hypothetical protein
MHISTHLELSILRQEIDRLRYFNSEAPAQQKQLAKLEKMVAKMEKDLGKDA